MCLEDRKVMDLMPDLVSFAGLFRMGNVVTRIEHVAVCIVLIIA